MSRPLCVVVGAGRLAGGFIAPLLHDAGWEVVLSGRESKVISSINARGGLWTRILGTRPSQRWVDNVRAVEPSPPKLKDLICRAGMLATSVGPTALGSVGRLLGPLILERLTVSSERLNIIAFENHRRASELLALGMLEAEPRLAPYIGTRLGIAGSAAWCVAPRRFVDEEGVYYDADDVTECYVDKASLVPPAPPLDCSVPGLRLVQPFESHIVEKLWVFNAGHAAAAYLGWRQGCTTLSQAMGEPSIRASVATVVSEAQRAFQATHATGRDLGSGPARSIEGILERYADQSLDDSTVRVAREPRRKLSNGDRLLGPAVACVGAGLPVDGLAAAAAAALAYGDPSDRQAVDLQQELALVGPEEVLATVSMLDPGEELTRVIAERYRDAHAIGAPG